jgi:hypothetical protein
MKRASFGAPSPRVLSPHERATEHDTGRFENEIAFKGRLRRLESSGKIGNPMYVQV